jgi:hypothetical protein
MLYLLAREKAGEPGATSDQLRVVTQAKKCYDSGNFTRNLKNSRNFKAYGNPGKGDTEWLLTDAGRDSARALIRRLCGADNQPRRSARSDDADMQLTANG